MGNEQASAKTELTDNEIRVLKANTNFSEQEIRKLYDGFRQESPSRRMNEQQLIDLYNKTGHPEYADPTIIQRIFSICDTNRDGTIDFSEFVLTYGLVQKKDLDSHLALAFEMIDTSRDGNITFQEMVKFLEYGKKMSEKKEDYGDVEPSEIAEVVFEEFGLNTEQKLSKEQFIKGCKSNEDLKQMFGHVQG